MKFWKENLMVRLVGYFLILSLATTSIVAVTTYVRARRTLTQSVFDQLTAVAKLKERNLVRWVDTQRQETLLIARLLESKSPVLYLLQLETEESLDSLDAYQSSFEELTAFLKILHKDVPAFAEIIVLTGTGGKIIASTEPTHQGEYRVLDSYFIQGREDTFIRKVYPSPITGRPTLTISTPLQDEDGTVWGVLAVHLDLGEMDALVMEQIGAGQTSETYLVDAYNVFVSGERFGRDEYPRGVHTTGIDTAVQGISGASLYKNYAGIPVIGAYRWIDKLGVALITEMYQDEAFAAADRLTSTIALVSIASAIVLTVGVYLLAKQIAQPILAITETAVQIAQGDLTQSAPVTTEDEVGLLARTFNQMTGQLRELYAQQEEKVAELQLAETALREAHDELEERVEERTAELTLLNRASNALISTLDQDQVFITVLEELRHLLDVVACSVWLVEEKTGDIVCHQNSGPQDEDVRGWRLAKGEGIIGWVVENGRSQLISDALTDPRHYTRLDKVLDLTTRSLITIPLVVQGRIIGALQALDSEPDRFNASDLALMESLAATAAFAIENARLYSLARHDAELRSILLREVNHRVKNNLSAIIGILYAERRHTDLQDKIVYQSIMQDLISRVQGLSTVHNLLSQAEWTPISLETLINQVIHAALRALPSDKQLHIEITPSVIRVTPDQANYLALVINELTTNAMKYTLSQRHGGILNVDISSENSFIILKFRDDGPGYPADVLLSEEPRYNVGLYLLQNIVQHSLNGKLILQNGPNGIGAAATIQFEADTQVG
ncbi:MAG: GAF domain-containing protein [Ardenticatenaceae bacterium]|nr:GAF domain-containing protein [Ardenticatenaceae bacterium]MCB9443181.1 GAF domain-containing protein [Ardenticatenaceae bacterium]